MGNCTTITIQKEGKEIAEYDFYRRSKVHTRHYEPFLQGFLHEVGRYDIRIGDDYWKGDAIFTVDSIRNVTIKRNGVAYTIPVTFDDDEDFDENVYEGIAHRMGWQYDDFTIIEFDGKIYVFKDACRETETSTFPEGEVILVGEGCALLELYEDGDTFHHYRVAYGNFQLGELVNGQDVRIKPKKEVRIEKLDFQVRELDKVINRHELEAAKARNRLNVLKAEIEALSK